MKKTTFKVLSQEEQQQVTGGRVAGASHGTIVGWHYTNGMYYVDIRYDSGEDSCEVPWGTSEPQLGDFVG